ncbi:MAG: ABC transporter substrate-binding protein [Reyranellaceae bacterium]
MRKIGSFLSAALAAATLVGAGIALAQPRHGGTLTMMVEPEPPTLLTGVTTSASTLAVTAKVTEGLLSYDFELKPRPQLATAWHVSADGLTYRFELRRNVKWHDGRSFSARDVAFSIRTMQQVHPRGRTTFANVKDIATPDDHTVVLSLSQPAPYLLYALAATETPIVPEHVYKGDASRFDANPNARSPVGTGPFVFKEWVRGSHIVYERNPDYWDKPKPYVDRIIVRVIPDAAARSVAIETGAIDLALNTPVPPSELQRLQSVPHLGFETDGYQYNNYLARMEFNLERETLAKREVREAIVRAIDREALLRVVFYGYGDISDGPISPGLKRFYAPAPRIGFDPALAEQILDRAGLARKPNGTRFALTLDYIPSGGDTYKRSAEFIKQSLAKVGIDVTVRSQDYSAYVRRVYTERDFDFTVHFTSNLFDPTIGVQRLFWSKNFRKGVPFSNGSAYNNPEVDRLLEAAAVEADEKKRFEHFAAFQKKIAEDLPDFALIGLKYVTIYNKRVVDHTMGANGASENLANVYLKN